MAVEEDGPIGTLSRGLYLLTCVAQLGGQATLIELVERSGLNRATTHRLATKLADLGYLERDSSGRFRLGLQVLHLGFAYLSSLDLRTLAMPELERLRGQLNCSVGLCVLDDLDVVYIERLESTSFQPTLRIGVGSRLPVHSTSIGKVIIAFSSASQRAGILERIRFERYTGKTYQTHAQLEVDLLAIRKRGYAISDQEHFEGYRAVAAPILNKDGLAAGGIVAGAALGRFSTIRELREVAAPSVVQAAQQVSRKLGWAPKAIIY